MIGDPIVSGIQFCEETHTYALDGKRLPSVTQVLDLLDPFYSTPSGIEAGIRGTIVHDACQYHDENQLDESAVPEDCTGYLRAWQKFRAECPFEVIATELILAHKTHLYGARIDRIVSRGCLMVLDIKSGAERAIHKLQLAAYCAAYESWTGNKIKKAACVYVRADGTYTVRWLDDPNALFDFLAALRVYRWKERNQ